MSSQIHVGDIGTQLIVAVFDDNEIVDISEAFTMRDHVVAPVAMFGCLGNGLDLLFGALFGLGVGAYKSSEVKP